jgi:hypothetical protein
MFKLIKICKIICIAFTFGLFIYLGLSLVANIKNTDYIDEIYLIYDRNSYIYEFFQGLAEAAFFYLFIHFVEKWCIKNEIK